MSSLSPAPSTSRNGDRAESSGIFGQLVDEWSRLCLLPSLGRQLRRWATIEPILAGTATLQDLLTRIDEGDRTEDDLLLGALIRLAQAGQTMAGRIVLQAMLPKLIRLSRTTRSTSDSSQNEDHRHVIVATFWTILAGYPIGRRTSSVAAGLALDTLHEITAELRRGGVEIPLDPQDAGTTLHREEAPTTDPPHHGPLNPEADLLEVIAWGLDAGVLTSEDAALLVRVYLPEPGQKGTAAAAAALGLTPAALRQRSSRARRRLIAAVQAEALGRPAPVPPTSERRTGPAAQDRQPAHTFPS